MLIVLLWVGQCAADRAIVVGAEPRHRTALVIGNAGYRQGNLQNSVHDASEMKSKLQELGFDVLYAENVQKRDMKDAVRQFPNDLPKDGVALFYGRRRDDGGNLQVIKEPSEAYMQPEKRNDGAMLCNKNWTEPVTGMEFVWESMR